MTVITHGVLGWGNRKTGLEAYGPEGRWGGGMANRDGHLLGDHLEAEGATEGAVLIVVAVNRRDLPRSTAEIDTLTGVLRQAIEETVREVVAT